MESFFRSCIGNLTACDYFMWCETGIRNKLLLLICYSWSYPKEKISLVVRLSEIAKCFITTSHKKFQLDSQDGTYTDIKKVVTVANSNYTSQNESCLHIHFLFFNESEQFHSPNYHFLPKANCYLGNRSFHAEVTVHLYINLNFSILSCKDLSH